MRAFELRDEQGRVKHKLYMIRNPWAFSLYRGKWSFADKVRWKKEYVEQIPYDINPFLKYDIPSLMQSLDKDGIFFIS